MYKHDKEESKDKRDSGNRRIRKCPERNTTTGYDKITHIGYSEIFRPTQKMVVILPYIFCSTHTHK